MLSVGSPAVFASRVWDLQHREIARLEAVQSRAACSIPSCCHNTSNWGEMWNAVLNWNNPHLSNEDVPQDSNVLVLLNDNNNNNGWLFYSANLSTKKTQCASTHHLRKCTHKHNPHTHACTQHDPLTSVEMPVEKGKFWAGLWSQRLRELRSWGDSASWQAANSRQLEQGNWKNSDQQIWDCI